MEPDQALAPRRRGPKLPPLVLTDEERATLERWARRRTSSQALAERCRIVLACAEGASNIEVADRLGVSRPTVTKWRSRFVARRLEGLADEPRPGAPRQITDEQVERVIVMTLEQAPKDATHWSTRSLARTLGMSQTSISRIWRAFGLKPHLTEAFKLSTDPQFIEKVRDIVGLYLDPPEAALVLCVDEKTSVQALDRTAPILPLLPGTPQRATHDYTRHGTTNLYAALDVASGKVISQLTARHRAIEFKRFLVQLDHSVPADLGVHVICDNSSTHKTPAIQRWLVAHPRFQLHFTPTYSSWLNLVERWFAELTTKWLRRGSHRSVAELEQAIQAWVEGWNQDPRPFVWTKTADEILDTIAHYCQRINHSGHYDRGADSHWTSPCRLL
jgi:transposase